jgi:hypothetical protein
MAVHGYILIDAEVGKAKTISDTLSEFKHPDARVIAVDTVTGPYDVIWLEADDLDKRGASLPRASSKWRSAANDDLSPSLRPQYAYSAARRHPGFFRTPDRPRRSDRVATTCP